MDDRIKASRRQEKDTARSLGGQVNSGSGNGEKFKADVRTKDELLELKTTSAKSYSLKAADLQKLWQQALLDDRQPVFGVEFQNMPGHAPKDWVILPQDDYLAMRGES